MNYEWESPAPGVYRCRLPFLDVTVGVVAGRDDVLLIDCGTTLSEAAKIAADVRELTGSAVSRLVMTHYHFDHILGAPSFPGAQIYAAPPVTAALTVGLPAVRDYALQYGAKSADLNQAIAAARPPDHIVWDADIDLGGRIVRVEHPGRGHTDHDLVVIVPPSDPGGPAVVFCGDLVEQAADPAIGPDSDVAAWPATLDRMLTLGGDDAIYVPGHGAMVDAGFVRTQRDWLVRGC
jgi:glyoxylase-like metal-dependent hydrolase (beta-lactamase superfamily II)